MKEIDTSGYVGKNGNSAFTEGAERPDRPSKIVGIDKAAPVSGPTHRIVSPDRVGQTVFQRPRLDAVDSSAHAPISPTASSDASLHVRLPDEASLQAEQAATPKIAKSHVVVKGVDDDLFTGEFAEATWSSGRFNAAKLTTDPEMVHTMLQQGPSAFDKLGDGETREIVTLDTDVKTPRIPMMHKMQFANGLITVHRGIPYADVEINGSHDSIPMDTSATERHPYSMANRMYDGIQFLYAEQYAYDEVPALQDAFDALGFSQTRNTKTVPTPGEYKRRMDHLRTTDTQSGVYYPEIEIFDTGRIDTIPYLNAYANNRHGISGQSFDYMTHDTASDHAIALMTYGKPLMDVFSNLAQVALENGDPLMQDAATETIDRFSGNLGGRGLLEDEDAEFSDGIVNTLRAAERLDTLEIVQWMKERGMVKDSKKITTALLYQGLKAHAKERLIQT